MRYLRLLPIVVLVITTLVLEAKTVKSAPENTNEQIPRNLVLRLLDYSPFTDGSNTQLLIGQLPKQLPVALPLPEGAKVVASVVRQTDNIQILLDAPQSPELVEAFYLEKLSATGWKSLKEPLFGPRGFSPSQANLSTPTAYCKEGTGTGASLFLVAKNQQQSLTDVRITINTTPRNSFCNVRRSTLAEARYERIPFPNLPAPPNTQVSPSGGGGGSDNWYSTATIVSQSDMQSLLAHYENQFKQAGWTKQDAKQSESMVWSSWMIKDKEGKFWQGVLSLRKVEGTSNYAASAIVF